MKNILETAVIQIITALTLIRIKFAHSLVGLTRVNPDDSRVYGLSQTAQMTH